MKYDILLLLIKYNKIYFY